MNYVTNVLCNIYNIIIDTFNFLSEVTVILLVEFAVGVVAIVSGFGFKHTYLVSVCLPF